MQSAVPQYNRPLFKLNSVRMVAGSRGRTMTEDRSCFLRVKRPESEGTHVIELPLSARDIDGWNEHVTGWAIGAESSDAFIKIDEPGLDNASLGILPASNHVILWDKVPFGHTSLPFIAFARDGDAEAPAESSDKRMRQRDDHVFSCRFDTRPLRIGRHVISFSYWE